MKSLASGMKPLNCTVHPCYPFPLVGKGRTLLAGPLGLHVAFDQGKVGPVFLAASVRFAPGRQFVGYTRQDTQVERLQSPGEMKSNFEQQLFNKKRS
ncbi:hypothetical protein MTO96_048256 [Rhipicephalus appendiculatus]